MNTADKMQLITEDFQRQIRSTQQTIRTNLDRIIRRCNNARESMDAGHHVYSESLGSLGAEVDSLIAVLAKLQEVVGGLQDATTDEAATQATA